MPLPNKLTQTASLVIEIYAECRYHNGAGYAHHPAFRYRIVNKNGECMYPDSLDLKELEAQQSTSQAVNAADTYIVNDMPAKIAQLIEGEFDGSG